MEMPSHQAAGTPVRNRDAGFAAVRADIAALEASLQRHIRGKDAVIRDAVVCLLASGHLLVEDLPGLGKTSLAYALARSLDCAFSRIQFTSDLLPSDVVGVSVYDERERQFVFRRGPVFANIVLADEINRATPKTQSSLLEVMDRGRISVDGETHPAGLPFMVIATQNPVDFASTFPLPESQLDRFLMRLSMGYPSREAELEILERPNARYDAIAADAVMGRSRLVELQQTVPEIFVERSVLDYLLGIVERTRQSKAFAVGASVRASLNLRLCAQAAALVDGRDFVLPGDIARFAPRVLAHRLRLRQSGTDGLGERQEVEQLVRELVDEVEIPL